MTDIKYNPKTAFGNKELIAKVRQDKRDHEKKRLIANCDNCNEEGITHMEYYGALCDCWEEYWDDVRPKVEVKLKRKGGDDK